MKIETKHPNYPVHVVRRAAAWCAKQIELPSAVLRRVQIEVRHRKNRRGKPSWGGLAEEWPLRVTIGLPQSGYSYPADLAHAASEEGRAAADEWELLVNLLAHELEHIRCFSVSRTTSQSRRLNQESRVRAVDWRVLQEFRADRERLVASWTASRATPCQTSGPTPAERREARVRAHLAAWERRLKLAKTKVAKYRAKARYYDRRRASVS